MLRLTRNVPKRVSVPLTRGLAEVVPAKRTSSVSVTRKSKATRILEQGRVPVKEDHGLWAFFRRKQGDDLVGEARYETTEHPVTVEQHMSGRAWRASELRLKSFEDLHTLWYLVLRERNLLATQKEEARRMGLNDPTVQVSSVRVQQCRKTMARIKAMLNERRLAYEGAMELIEKQRQKGEDAIVMQYQRQQHEAHKRVLSRRELTDRRRAARLKSKESQQVQSKEIEGVSTADAQVQAGETESASNEDAEFQAKAEEGAREEAQTGADVVEAQSGEAVPPPSEPTEAPSSSLASSEDTKAVERLPKKVKEVQRKPPKNPADAAADGLFGGGRR